MLIATKPVDFRKGIDGLEALVAAELKLESFSGIVYVFRSKRAGRVRLLFWDGTGVFLLTNRLEGGNFRWPKVEDGVMRLSPAPLPAWSVRCSPNWACRQPAEATDASGDADF